MHTKIETKDNKTGETTTTVGKHNWLQEIGDFYTETQRNQLVEAAT